MRSHFDTLRLKDAAAHVLLVELHRPEAANAINTQMGRELLDLFASLAAEVGVLTGVVVLTGAGPKAFCAGGDLKERAGMTDEQWLAQHALFERMTVALLDCPIPVIAAVNGAAFGGGTEIALCADLVHAARTASFALTEVRLGIMPGCGGTQNLPRAVGIRRAKEIIFSGRPFSAQQAYDWGLATRLCDPSTLLDETLALATAISQNAPLAVRQAKKAIGLGMQVDLRSALLVEIEAYNRLVPTEDRREGVRAFAEKRPPRFVGR